MNYLNKFIICAPLIWILLSETIACGIGTDVSDRIPAGTYHYLEQSEKGISHFEWRISYPGNLVEITVESRDYRTFNRCRPDGETIFWSVSRSDGLEVSAERENDVLIITQTSTRGKKTVEYDIDGRPWYQPLSYSLVEFLASERQSAEFWCIRMDTNKPVMLRATKNGREELIIEDQLYTSVKVEIKATGLLSMLWSGSYWFNADNDLFLQYTSRIGIPGMASKNVTLMSRTAD